MSEVSKPYIKPIPVLKAWLDEPLEDRVMALVEDPSLLELVRDLIEQLAIAETERDDFEASQARLLEQYESRERELFGTGKALANADRVAGELTKRIAELVEQLEAALALLRRVEPELVPNYETGQDLAQKFGLDLQRMQLIEDIRSLLAASTPATSPDGAENNPAASRLAGATASRSAPPSPRDRGVLSPPLREDCDPAKEPDA